MNQMNKTIYQSNLVSFDDVKDVLHSMCNEGHSGIFFISSANGDGAGFSLDHGKITDVAYKAMRGNKALSSIKNIERARFFFGQGQLTLPFVTKEVDDLPDTAKILSFLNINVVHKVELTQEEPVINGKVMIVDDSRMVRAVVKKILTKGNYEVIEAVDGDSALLAIEQEHPDLVLLDIVMPGIDGNEVLRRVRLTESGKNLPVVVLTSNDSLVNEGIGESGRFPKPFKSDELLLMLRDFFPSNELKKEHLQ